MTEWEAKYKALLAGSEKTKLKRALRSIGASEWHWRAASILYSVNGFDNAMGYVERLRERKARREMRQLELGL